MLKPSAGLSARITESISVLLVASILTVMLASWMGYDFRYLSSVSIGDQFDTPMETWSLYQATDNLLHRPLNLGYSTIFYGEPSSFGATTAIYGIALFMLPVFLVTQNVILTFNIYFLLTWILTALAAYWLIRYLLGVEGLIALFGALMIAFSQARVTRIAQIGEISIQFYLIAVYCLHRLIDTPKLRWAIGLCLGVFFTMFSSGYVGMMFVVTGTIIFVYAYARNRLTTGFWRYFLIAIALNVVISAPFLAFRLNNSAYQTGHSYEETQSDTATIEDWVSGSSVIYKDLMPHVGSENEVLLFLGFVPLVLSALAWLWRKDAQASPQDEPPRKFSSTEIVVLYGLIIAIGYLFTLGPTIRFANRELLPMPYLLLRQLPGFSGMRSLARFIVLPILGTGILSVFAIHVLSRKVKPQVFVIALLGLVSFFTIESIPYNASDISTNIFPYKRLSEARTLPVEQRRLYPKPYDPNTPVNQWLAAQPAGTPIFQFPADIDHSFDYLLDELYHHQPMINGSSVAYIPNWYADAHWELFPSLDLMSLLNTHHIQYIIVHRDSLSIEQNVEFSDRLEATRQIWGGIPLIQTFGTVEVYRVTAQKPGANVQMTFSEPQNGLGWYAPQDGYTWTGPGTESTLQIPFVAEANGDAVLRFRVVRVLSFDILGSLKVRVNGELIPMTMTSDNSSGNSFALLFEGVIPKADLDKNPGTVVITFDVSRTVSPQDLKLSADINPVGLQFDWLQVDTLATF